MKKYYAFLGAAMFFVVCMSLYLMLESTNSGSAAGGNMLYEGGNSMNGIEAKIKKIEADLQYNHKMINLIKDTFKDIADGDDKGLVKLQQQFNQVLPSNADRHVVHNKSQVRLSDDVCLFGSKTKTSSTGTNVNIADVMKELPFDNPDGGSWKQGWDVRYDIETFKQRKLRVFVVPHSHNDPGWLKTFERYYEDQTKYILENMLVKLEEHTSMKFIYAEMSFFSLWWSQISSSKRERVKKLIGEGRLEIATGGWVMTDEANAHYFAMLDQLIEGNQWLMDNVGVKPKSGWAIDPFGQSPTMAYILKGSGFENMLIQRVHYTIKKYLAKRKWLEFKWRQEWDQDGHTDMFCHMMPFYSYDVPHTCGPDPKVCCQFDFKRLPGGRVTCPWKIPPQEINSANIEKRAELLLDQYRKKSQLYQNNVVLVPLGDDFRYDKTVEWDNQFNNYQKLFEYMNSRDDWYVEAKFGTLSDYFETAKAEAGQALPNIPVLNGDFFTYSDRDDHYWSGYYTSRPFYKRLDRVMEAHLRSAEIIYTLASATAKKKSIMNFPEAALYKSMTSARRSLGLYQHHDGITGTAKDPVVADYGKKLLQGIMDMKVVIKESAHFLMMKDESSYAYDPNFFDIDEVRATHDSLPDQHVFNVGAETQTVVFYNSLAHHRQTLVTLLVTDAHVAVVGPGGDIVTSQITPYWIRKAEVSEAMFKLHFVVCIDGLSLSAYSIKKMERNEFNTISSIEVYNGQMQSSVFNIKDGDASSITIEDDELMLNVDTSRGTLNSVVNKRLNKKWSCTIFFMTYGTVNKKDKSGAYLFMPDGEARPMEYSKPLIRVTSGPLLKEVFSSLPHVDHHMSIHQSDGVDSQGIHIRNIVDIRDEYNKELVMRVHANIANTERNWFSDLNGFQTQERTTFDKIPLQGNFYPMPTMSYLEDRSSRMTLLTGQSLGVASLREGTIEVILDRRLNQDDNRGLGQGVTDNKKTENIFVLLLESLDESSGGHVKKALPSLVAQLSSLEVIHPIHMLPRKDTSVIKLPTKQNLLQTVMPCDVHLLNLRSLAPSSDKKEAPHSVFLHRLPVDCRIASSSLDLVCPSTYGKTTLDIFKDLIWDSPKETTLNLLHEKDAVSTNQAIELPIMEIKAFRGSLH